MKYNATMSFVVEKLGSTVRKSLDQYMLTIDGPPTFEKMPILKPLEIIFQSSKVEGI